jgi:carbon starvation protein
MLTEAFLATLVIVACGAGIAMALAVDGGEVLSGSAAWNRHYASWGAAAGLGSKVGAFVEGSANMIGRLGLPKEIALVVMGVFVASFAGTTLDTATRIQRYVISELGTDFRIPFLANRYTATAIAVVTAAGLAFWNGVSGKGALTLWPLFGTVNQLLAGLALLIVSYYLRLRGRNFLLTLIPAFLVIVFTSWALVLNLIDFAAKGNVPCLLIGVVALLLEIWMIVESLALVFRPMQRVDAATPAKAG